MSTRHLNVLRRNHQWSSASFGGLTMLDSATHTNLFLVNYCRSLLAEVPDERMTEQPLPGVNHAAWVLGHLAVVADGAMEKLGGKKTLPPSWPALFATGSKPSATRS